MGNLEQVLAPNQVISDSIFLRINRRGLGVYGQPIDINHTPYEVFDPSSPKKWHAYLRDVDVVIFVFSLTSYYQFSDGDTKTVRNTRADRVTQIDESSWTYRAT